VIKEREFLYQKEVQSLLFTKRGIFSRSSAKTSDFFLAEEILFSSSQKPYRLFFKEKRRPTFFIWPWHNVTHQ
jgi:hypothetical protein